MSKDTLHGRTACVTWDGSKCLVAMDRRSA